MSRAGSLLASGPVECRSRGSLDFRYKGELFSRQRRAALVGEAYIVGGPSNCQHRFRTFLNFLRRYTGSRFGRCVKRLKQCERGGLRPQRSPIPVPEVSCIRRLQRALTAWQSEPDKQLPTSAGGEHARAFVDFIRYDRQLSWPQKISRFWIGKNRRPECTIPMKP
jgi:hypothetical protein